MKRSIGFFLVSWTVLFLAFQVHSGEKNEEDSYTMHPPYELDWPYKEEKLLFKSCGCAGLCWVVILTDWHKNKEIAKLHCNCTKLRVQKGKGEWESLGMCDVINNADNPGIVREKILMDILGRSTKE